MRRLLADNPLLLRVLTRFGIALGFGDSSVECVCDAAGVHTPTFVAVANFISNRSYDLHNVHPATLVHYLRNAHEYYISYVLPGLRRQLIEAVSTGETSELSLAMLKFFDEYAQEVQRHMEYEENTVFEYVDSLIAGKPAPDSFRIAQFAQSHQPMSDKLAELKELIICHFKADTMRVDLLNTLLFDIVMCERDLLAHCKLEDMIFVPVVQQLEKNGVPRDTPLQLDTNGDVELTARERQIISLVAKGLSNKEIAQQLCLSVHTIATHRRNICSKLNLHSASALTLYALMHKL